MCHKQRYLLRGRGVLNTNSGRYQGCLHIFSGKIMDLMAPPKHFEQFWGKFVNENQLFLEILTKFVNKNQLFWKYVNKNAIHPQNRTGKTTLYHF